MGKILTPFESILRDRANNCMKEIMAVLQKYNCHLTTIEQWQDGKLITTSYGAIPNDPTVRDMENAN